MEAVSSQSCSTIAGAHVGQALTSPTPAQHGDLRILPLCVCVGNDGDLVAAAKSMP